MRLIDIQTVGRTKSGGFVVNEGLSDQVYLNDEMGNPDRVIIQDWIDAGNTPTPYVALVPTWEEQIAESDATMMDRAMEDLITLNSLAMSTQLKAKYDAKTALRNSKPA